MLAFQPETHGRKDFNNVQACCRTLYTRCSVLSLSSLTRWLYTSTLHRWPSQPPDRLDTEL